MRSMYTSVFKRLLVQSFAVLLILLVGGNFNKLSAQLGNGSTGCTTTTALATAATPTCSAQSLTGASGHTSGLGAGESVNVPLTNNVYYTFTYTNNSQSSGICIAGTQYTNASPFVYHYTGTTGNVLIGMYRSSASPWVATSAILQYQVTTPSQAYGGTATGTYCPGTLSISCTPTNGTSYWQTTTSGGQSVSLGGTPENVTSAGTYYYNTYNGGCWSGTGTGPTISYYTTPVVTATPSTQSICSATAPSIALTSTVSGTTYAWTVAQASGITGGSNSTGTPIAQTLTNSSTTTSATATYTITGTANGCASSNITATITVNPKPAITATPSTETICSGTAPSIALTSSIGSTTYAWSVSEASGITGGSSSTGTPIAQTLSNSSHTTSATATYTITGTAPSTNCTGSTTAVITVNPTPTITVTPATVSICDGAAPSLALTSSIGSTTYTWSETEQSGVTGASSGSGTPISQALSNSNATTTATATYTVTGTAPSTNCTASATGIVTVYPQVQEPSFTTCCTIVSCGPATIDATSDTNGTTCYFYGPNSTTTFLNSGTSYTTPTYSTSTTNNYYVESYNTTWNCASTQVDVTVTVNPSFTLTLSNPNNVAYGGYGVKCNGLSDGDILATVSSTAYPISYDWSSGANNTGISASTNNAYSTNTMAAGTYEVTVTDHNGCVQSGSFDLLSPTPVTGSTTTVSYGGYGTNCNGGADGSATATGSGGNSTSYTYSWAPTGYTGATTATYSALPANTYTVTVTDANSCTGTTTAVITQPNTINFTYSISYICNGLSYTSATITVVPTGGASGTYQCQNNGGSWTTAGTYTFTGLANGSSNTIVVRDASYTGCTSASQNITITFPTIGSNASNCNFIYVSSTGGGTLGTPACPTSLTTALTLVTGSLKYIILQSGTYNLSSTFTIPANVTLDGGYDVDGNGNWYKSTNTATNIVINPPLVTETPYSGTTVGAYIGMNASGNGFTLKDINVSVVPGGNTGNTNGYGNSIYGLYLSGQTGYLISRCAFSTGAAGTGSSGGTPSGTGGGYGGGSGGGGGSGWNCGTSCSLTSVGGSGGGSGSQVWATESGGGGGGGCTNGGCNTAGCNSSSCNGSGGGSGANGSAAPAYSGQPSPNNSSNGYLSYFIPVTGSQGYEGDGGAGGGGGGGGVTGGCCTCSCGCGADYGSNGGAGGAGGAGGYGGQGGGGTFPVYIWGGSGTFTTCSFSAGAGGAAGSGGTGQSGNAGSAGGSSNPAGGCNNAVGAAGGNGGSGGKGGTGQSGMTGPSVGIEILNSASITQNSDGSVPTDGTITAEWYSGCLNSEITLTKTSGNNWSGIGSNPYFEDNLNSASSSYSSSTNTAVIYYTSGSGNQNIATTGATLYNYIDLIGTRLTPVASTVINTITAPCPGASISLTNSLTGTQAGNVVTYEWEITNGSGTVLYSSAAANPGTVNSSSITGGLVAGTTYWVRLRLQEQCCGWSIPIWQSFTVLAVPAAAGSISGPTSVCPASTQTYSITAVPTATNYTWTVSGGSVQTGQGSTSITVLWGPAGSASVSVLPSNGCGNAASSTSLSVTIDGAPVVAINPTTTTAICYGASNTLNSGVTSGGSPGNGTFTYSWSNSSNASGITVSPSTNTAYSITVTEGGSSCTASSTYTVTVEPALNYGTVSGTTPQTLCNNATPTGTFSVSGATGSAGFTYQWYYESNNTASNPGGGTSTAGWTSLGSTGNANTATFIPQPITGNTSYACFVTPTGSPTCGTPTWANGVINVTVEPAMNYGTVSDASGNTQTICYGTVPSGNMVASGAAGSSSFTYQWYYQSGIVSAPTVSSTSGWTACGASQGTNYNTATFTASAITASTTYACFVTPTGSPICGTATWATGDIQVTVLPTVTYGTASDASGNTQTICYGAVPSGNMVASGAAGSSGFTYQWYYKSGIVSAPSGSSTSGWTACGASQGSGYNTATFSASAITANTTYACYVTPTGSPTCGIGTWATGAMQITVEPAISYGTATDASGNIQTICVNTAPTGNMVASGATGSGSFTYQWYYQSGIVSAPSGTNTTGWTACTATQGSGYSTSTFTASSMTASATFACLVTPTGSPTCGTATWATGAIQITVDPLVNSYGNISASVNTVQSLCPNVTPAGTFTVINANGGSGSFTYQWYSQSGIASEPSGSNTTGWTPISGATNASYAPLPTSSSISYACIVTPVLSCAGTATWATGVLNFTVSTPTSFLTGGDDTVCTGGTVTLTASTPYVATWTWQSCSTANGTYGPIIGANSSTYSPPTSTTGTVYYQAIATYSGNSGCTPATSNYEYVVVVAQPTITTEPGSVSMCQGGTGHISTVFTGGAGATYQWETNYGFGYTGVSDNNSNAPGITYGGTGTQNPLDITSSASSYTGTLPYKIIIYFSASGCPASITSSAGSATINPQPTIATQPTSTQSMCAGSSTTLNVSADPGFTLSYEWQYYNTATSSWSDVTAGTPAGFSYTPSGSGLTITTTNGTSPAGSYQFQVIVHSTGQDCNPVTSSSATIVIIAHPNQVTPTVSSNPVCITSTGGGTNIQIASSQSGVNYQLQNIVGPTNVGSVIPGTGGSINLPTGSMSANTTYQVLATTVSGGCTTTTSILDTVTAVNPDIAIGTQITGDHFTFGTIGSPALPSSWSNPGSGGLQWTLATSNPASSGSYSYYNSSGGTSSASTGAYIQTPAGSSATVVSLISSTINTTGYTNISVQWGAQKSAGYAGNVNLYYSTDNGSTWSSAVSFTDVPDNLTGSPWSLVNNTVQVKLPVACNNISTLMLKWTANAASSGVYYSMNDIGVYGLSTLTNCGTSVVSLKYLNTSCSASKYNIGTSTVAGVGSAWPSLATVSNGTLPSSPVSITVPANTATGTYDIDFTVNDGAGHSSSTINFPVTTDPAINVIANLDNCSCNNTLSIYGNIVSVYASGGTGVFYFNSGAVVDSLMTTIDASGNNYSGTLNHNGVKGVFWSKTDGNTHTYTISDGVCSTSATQVTQSTKPGTIPFGSATGVPSQASGLFGGGNGISGSFNNAGQGDPTITTHVNGPALTCHQTSDFGSNWVTYQVNNINSLGQPLAGDSTNNKAVVEINNNGVDLDSVSVSVYRDANLPAIPNAATQTTACFGYVGYALERHFMIKSTKSTGANSFGTPVGVRLYFTDAEFQDLKYWTMEVATTATGQDAGCAYLDTVTNMNSIYVTKYTGTNEDGNYLNNQPAPSGLYRVFGKNAANNGNQPLTAIDGGQGIFTTGGTTNLHYVQMNVTEFSEFWLGGSQGADALPVEMIYLEAEALNNDSIQVRWGTATEINNREFDVERSTDANTWTTIGIVPGHDNSTEQINYVYNDLNVAPGVTYYYRLKQVDNNGNYQYTDVVQAMINGTRTFTVMNFVPNPTSGNTQLTVVTSKNQEITVDFYDMLGQKILSANEQLVPGDNKINFDLHKFAAGTYSAVVTADNQLYTKKIVITR